jgi:hypothetical protein
LIFSISGCFTFYILCSNMCKHPKVFSTRGMFLYINRWKMLRWSFCPEKHNTEKCTAKNSKFVVIFMHSFMSVRVL